MANRIVRINGVSACIGADSDSLLEIRGQFPCRLLDREITGDQVEDAADHHHPELRIGGHGGPECVGGRWLRTAAIPAHRHPIATEARGRWIAAAEGPMIEKIALVAEFVAEIP